MNTTNKSTKPAQSYLTVAAAVPKLRIGDVKFNIDQILKVLKSADSNNAEVTLLPEMSLTGYSLQDIFYQTYLHKDINTGLKTLLLGSQQINSVAIVGAPLVWHGKLYNCAIVIYKGKIFGVVPKSYIPNTNEFYEKRWFTSGLQIKEKHINVTEKNVPFGTDLIFELGNTNFGVEICEDVWAPVPPSTKVVLAGADVIFNLSASNEIVGKMEYRRQMISSYTAKLACGYVYASSGVTESTADIVMGGDAFITETGHILASGKRFSRKNEILVGDIDIDHIKHDRRQNTTIECSEEELRRIFIRERMGSMGILNRLIEPHPFVPKNTEKMNETIEEIFKYTGQWFGYQDGKKRHRQACIGFVWRPRFNACITCGFKGFKAA
jgi:NAD+ synthase (glutamine-hydrolysing)